MNFARLRLRAEGPCHRGWFLCVSGLRKSGVLADAISKVRAVCGSAARTDLCGVSRPENPLVDPLPTKEVANVLRAVNHSKNVHAVFERPVKDQNLLEARNAKEPKSGQLWKAESSDSSPFQAGSKGVRTSRELKRGNDGRPRGPLRRRSKTPGRRDPGQPWAE